MDKKLILVKLISKVTNDRETIAAILVKIFQASGNSSLFLIKELVSDEINSTRMFKIALAHFILY